MDPVKKLGTEDLEEAVDFAFNLADAVESSLEDGKISLTDAPKFLKTFMSSAKAIEGINNIPVEIGDLDEFELARIVDKVKARFDITDDILEIYVEDAFGHAVGLAVAIANIRKLKKVA
jgi:hypothetical protein